MPRNPLKNFRRKSSGNVLEIQSEGSAPTSPSSFRVLERSSNTGFDGGARAGSGKRALRPNQDGSKSVENLNLGTNRSVVDAEQDNHLRPILRSDRRSAGTTNSGSSGYGQGYDTYASSARYSSSSTLPSSLDADTDLDNGELYPVRQQQTMPMPSSVMDPPAPTFAAKAGRAFSFGLRSHRNSVSNPTATTSASSIQGIPTAPSTTRLVPNHTMNHPSTFVRADNDATRERAETTSSYASTAKPPQIDNADFGDDGEFDNMFDGLADTRSRSRDLTPPVSDQTEFAGPTYPPRAASRQETQSPNLLEKPRTHDSGRRYSWDSHKSSEQLISAPSTAPGSPAFETYPPGSPLPGFSAVRGYQAVPNRYTSPDIPDARASPSSNSGFMSAQSHRSSDDNREEANRERAVFRSELRRPTGERDNQPIVRPDSAFESSMPEHRQPYVISSGIRQEHPHPVPPKKNTLPPSPDATPRPKKVQLDVEDDSLFDSSPTGAVSRSINPGKQRAQDNTPKRMTRAQFEMAQQRGQLTDKHDRDDDARSEDGDTFDEEDEADQHKRMTAQRRRQEATMSVYRQQMKKVTGGQPSDLPSQATRPGLMPSMSSMSIGTVQAEDEDEDVPLGILKAHGFPTKSRPPTQVAGHSGYVAENGNAENLPAFARKLPVDPYFGAGLVNATNRESLAFANGGGGSVYGGGSVHGGASPQQPGGLVGVIASEERAKAARRGSPSPATGGYGPIPLPVSMSPSMPQYGRTNSMGSLIAPQMVAGGFYPQNGALPGMPQMSPAEHSYYNTQQQLAHMMQMQNQMMQQMMAMQSGQMPAQGFTPQPMPKAQDYMNGTNIPGSQRMSTYAPSIGAGRTMSMSNLSSNWTPMDRPVQPRSNTMGSSSMLNKTNYAGSVYGMNLSAGDPGAGYTPSIAPSERSNIGQPSRYRPVSSMDDVNQTHESALRVPSRPGSAPLTPIDGNAPKQQNKSTIRVIEKPKGAPKSMSSFFGRNKQQEDEDDDDEGWAEMARKKEAMRQKRATRMAGNEAPLGELYQGLA